MNPTHYCYNKDKFLYKSHLKYVLTDASIDFSMLSLYLEILASDQTCVSRQGHVDIADEPRVFAMPWLASEIDCTQPVRIELPIFETCSFPKDWVRTTLMSMSHFPWTILECFILQLEDRHGAGFQ